MQFADFFRHMAPQFLPVKTPIFRLWIFSGLIFPSCLLPFSILVWNFPLNRCIVCVFQLVTPDVGTKNEISDSPKFSTSIGRRRENPD